ncbi:MAG: type III pantothenate kinase [Planctomycetota bacterium]
MSKPVEPRPHRSESPSAAAAATDFSSGPLIALAVGNTRSRIGLFRGSELASSSVHRSDDAAGIAAAAEALSDDAAGDDNPTVAVSTVNPGHADAVEKAIREIGLRAMRFGRDMPIPFIHSLDDSGERTVGQDRLMCAGGAFAIVKQACVVVDLGTAATIDFVDGEGVFHGGAIAPGLKMMLSAMSEGTSALPTIEYERPASVFGKNTPDAMRLGVAAMVQGAVRVLAERYADYYEAYPRIVATGGDMGLLEDDELVETFLPDLQLHGIRRACEMLIEAEEEA